jgi:PAS domain S-box-containing protein
MGRAPEAVGDGQVLVWGESPAAVADVLEAAGFDTVRADAADLPTAARNVRADCTVLASDDPESDLGAFPDPFPPTVVVGDVDPGTAIAAGAADGVRPEGDWERTLVARVRRLIAGERAAGRSRASAMLDALLASIPVAVYFKDRRSRHVRVSDSHLRMIGEPYIENVEGKRFLTPADVVGNTDFDLFVPEAAQSAVADDRAVMETEKPITNREETYETSGERLHVATSKAPWYDERGEVVGTVGVTVDVTERKRYAEQLERQNERLEEFASVLSHDLRNPLTVAQGHLDLAAAAAEGAPEHLERVAEAHERIDEIIEDVLALARGGKAVNEPEPVDLAAAAADAWESVETGSATLSVAVDRTVTADPSRLRRLLENLFRNSVEHGSTGNRSETDDSVEHGSTGSRAAPGDSAEHGTANGRPQTDGADAPDPVAVEVGWLGEQGFYVADDGPGFEDPERVFESGYTTGDGTGLGLATVRQVADAHGWRVRATESERGGARIEIRA